MTTVSQTDARSAPATARNRDPILTVLRRILPARGTVLEIASGSGEHAAYFAHALPDLTWQPSDPDETARKSIAAHRERTDLPNLLPPLELDASKDTWPVTRVDAVIAINMIHIAPWEATQGLMAGAERVLLAGGVLYLYGPYKEHGQHTAPSNALFDADLMARNPEWGVRNLDDVRALAARHKFDFVERASMPANNLSVVFRKRVG
jgi:SAM-dependent methyltransferase